MAQIVPGTTKSLLFYVIIQINYFIITSYSLKNLQEPGLKIHKSQGQRWGKCFECFWARCKVSNLEVFWSNNGVITLKGFFSPWFCQCLRIDFNKFVCFPSKFIRQTRNHLRVFMKEIIILNCSLDGDLRHTTNVIYSPFSVTSNWPTLKTCFSFSFASIWRRWICLADLYLLFQLSLWTKTVVAHTWSCLQSLEKWT